MHVRRFAGVLLAVLLVASTLEDAVDAKRSLNKCCAPGSNLYYNGYTGVYDCETASEREARKESNDGDHVDNDFGSETTTGRITEDSAKKDSKTATSLLKVDNMITANPGNTDDPSGYARMFLDVLTNATLTKDDVVTGVFPPCYPRSPENAGYLFMPNFRLNTTPNAVTLLTGDHHEFAVDKWCLDLDDEDDAVIVMCPCADQNKPCVRKCCSRGEAFDDKGANCTESNLKPWEPRTRDSKVKFYKLDNTIPSCKLQSTEKFHRGELTILSDGSMQGHSIIGRSEKFSPGGFCVDAIKSTNATDNDGDLQVLFCIETDDISYAVTIFKGVVTLIGAFALLITVVLTSIFPEMRQNIHGKMALCHNSSLLLAFTCIGLAQVGGNPMNKVSCQLLSFVMQYTLLAAFFWLNVMCVEVSWVFSALRPVKKMMAGYVDRKFMWYSVYAWGTTSLISIITIIVEFTPGAKLKPRFGEANCFFHTDDKLPQLLFLFGPMAILLAINIGLFVFTATKIIKHRRQTSILKTNDSNTNNRNKQNLILYIKLFTLMGVTWIFEIVSWAVGGKNYYWLVIDCVNLLRGVFIFFIFCCKRSVLDLVRGLLGLADSKKSSQTSTGTKSKAASNEAQGRTPVSRLRGPATFARQVRST